MTSIREKLRNVSSALDCDFNNLQHQILNGLISANKTIVIRYCSDLLQGINLWPKTHSYQLDDLRVCGIESLCTDKYWLYLEIAAVKNLEKKKSQAFIRSLDFLYRSLFPDNYKGKKTNVYFLGTHVCLTEFYLQHETLGSEVKNEIKKFLTLSRYSDLTKISIVQQVVSIMKILVTDTYSSINSIFLAMLNENQLIACGIKKHRLTAVRSQIRAFIETVSPDTFSRVTIYIGKYRLDVTKLYSISKKSVIQIKSLAETDYYSGEYGHNLAGLKGHLSCSIRVIINYCNADLEFEKYFKKIGLDALSINGFRPLIEIFKLFKRHEATAVSFLYEKHSGIKVNHRTLFKEILYFKSEATGNLRSIDISALSDVCPMLQDDIKSIHEEETALLDQKNYGFETLHSRISKLLKVFTAYCKPEEIRGLGINFLSADDGKIQLYILSKIQSELHSKSISRRTAESYVSAIRWLCEITNQKFINAYRVTSNRHAVHALRLSNRDTYTLSEVRELAFHIEKGIACADTPLQEQLILHFARIQIKTCWNTSSLARIEYTDIQEADVPTSSRPVTVLIQKPRKGYQTDHFNFDYKLSRSAIYDLVKVRDQLTSSLREKYNDNKVASFLFIYEELGQIKSIDYRGITTKISMILCRLGCTVKYNSAKLRKTGSNEIYRQVSKDFRRYQDILKHSYPIFLKNYQRVSEASSKATLNDATKVMEQYFLGKEISSDIKIVTEYEISTQITPVGGCISEKNSKEANYYAKRNKVLVDDKIDRCGDFMACIWCKHYRIVADAEHVWQLLSFKEFVLGDMQGSIAHFPDESIQKQAHGALSERVSTIISNLKIINAKQVSLGISLFEKNGMHPIWNYAISKVGVLV